VTGEFGYEETEEEEGRDPNLEEKNIFKEGDVRRFVAS
jgi:hypothetical protein